MLFIANFGGQANNEEILQVDVIFLGVKPAQFSELLCSIPDHREKRESSFDFHGGWIDLGN